jgi:hypothetical protein
MEMTEVVHCDFCGISKEEAGCLHDLFELAAFPFLACSDCMDREFGPNPADPYIQVANCNQLVAQGIDPWGEEE